MQRLPEAEFIVMRAVWDNKPPVTASLLTEQIGHENNWRIQTVITLLSRLHQRGFLKAEKVGRERHYYPAISRETYLQYETGDFMHRCFGNSLSGFVTSLYHGKKLTEKDRVALEKIIKDRR